MGSLGENCVKRVRRKPGIPRRVEQMSKEMLQATLVKKRECNRRAQIIVERLLEENVPEDWFLGSLQYISESHFQDAVEERALVKLCGYPLCQGRLLPPLHQQFHISTRRNKVYDITDRKNFCSNRCYAAAKFLKQQLLTSPLWLRDTEQMPVFTILPSVSPSEGVGEELDLSVEKVTADERERVPQADVCEHIRATRPVIETSSGSPFKEADPGDEVLDESCLRSACNKSNSTLGTMVEVSNHDCTVKTLGNDTFDVGAKIRTCTEHASIDNKRSVECGKASEFTVESASNDKCSESSGSICCKSKEGSGSDKQHAANVGSCDSKFMVKPRRVDGKPTVSPRSVDVTHVNSVVSKKAETRKDTEVPGLQGLVLYVEKCVKEWFTEDTLRLLLGDEYELKEPSKDAGVPLVDHHAQTALRRRIVLDRLNRVVSDLLAALGVVSCDVSSDMRELVATFSLGAHNITFHMPEWNLLGLILINVASLKNEYLQQQLRSKKVKDAQAMILLSFQQDSGYLDRLMCWLTEVEQQTS